MSLLSFLFALSTYWKQDTTYRLNLPEDLDSEEFYAASEIALHWFTTFVLTEPSEIDGGLMLFGRDIGKLSFQEDDEESILTVEFTEDETELPVEPNYNRDREDEFELQLDREYASDWEEYFEEVKVQSPNLSLSE